MSHTLLLQLSGPMQSWGDESRYRVRNTATTPTKSGVVGLLAAAEGRRRTDPVEDLADLRFGVRVDQTGSLLRDYQTSQNWRTGAQTSLVTRHYLSDAVFIAAVESDDRDILKGLSDALKKPRFPLFLGRRSCPAPPGLVLGIRDSGLVDALCVEPWHALTSHRKERPTTVSLPIYRDACEGENGVPRQDVPLSFSQEHRSYGWREVVLDDRQAQVSNPQGNNSGDPFFEAVVSA